MIERADWRALGTGVRLVVSEADPAVARGAVERVLDDVDRTYSRFRPDSELMSVNAAAGRTIRISPLLARAVRGALEAARVTDGAVDPTVGGAMRIIGYDIDFGLLADRPGPLDLRVAPVPGWTALSFDPQTRLLRLPPNAELDLGSTGKGLAADLAAGAALEAIGGGGVLVGLGGDIALAGRPPEAGWQILAEEDSSTPAQESGEIVAMERGGIATSSTTVRRWRSAGGATLHHIVDPRIGLPARTPWRTATVVAASCEVANAASTAAIVLGHDAPGWLESIGLPARLVGADGRVIRIGGWPRPPARPRRH